MAFLIKSTLSYKIRDDLKIFVPACENLWIEINHPDKKGIVIGVVYSRDVEAEAEAGCGSGPFSVEAEAVGFSHRLFNLESNLAKKFCPFPHVDLSDEVAL